MLQKFWGYIRKILKKLGRNFEVTGRNFEVTGRNCEEFVEIFWWKFHIGIFNEKFKETEGKLYC